MIENLGDIAPPTRISVTAGAKTMPRCGFRQRSVLASSIFTSESQSAERLSYDRRHGNIPKPERDSSERQ